MSIQTEETRVLKVLADPMRLRIYSVLSSSSDGIIVSAIAGFLNVSQPLASHHLAQLEEVGLVKCESSAQYRIYKAAKEPVIKVIELLQSLLKENVNEAQRSETETT